MTENFFSAFRCWYVFVRLYLSPPVYQHNSFSSFKDIDSRLFASGPKFRTHGEGMSRKETDIFLIWKTDN